MNMKKYMESEYLNAKIIDAIEIVGDRKGVIISDVAEEDGKFGVKPFVSVELQGVKRKWNPSRLSCSNLGKAFGEESMSWVGKVIHFKTEMQHNDKMGVVGYIPDPDQTTL